jgi:Protein of unknown function DUF2625
MRTLSELLSVPDPAWPLVQGWITDAANPVEVLPSDPRRRDEALLAVQVTLRSVLGAIVHETGGLRVDHGWVRVLGSGHPRLTRSLASWNVGRSVDAGAAPGLVLVADDVLGGFFAINGGALDADPGHVCYFAPDTLAWMSLGVPYSEFILWLLHGDVAGFYQDSRWEGWEREVEALSGDMAFSIFPPLFTESTPIQERSRRPVPVEELYGMFVGE